MVGWLCFTSHRQQGHLETAPPFIVPCEGHEGHFLTVTTGNRTPSCGSPLHYRCASPVPPYIDDFATIL